MFFSCVLREGNLASPKQKIKDTHCVKRVHIRSFSGPYFTEYGEIQSECGKIQTRKTPNTGTFHAVNETAEVNPSMHNVELWPNIL